MSPKKTEPAFTSEAAQLVYRHVHRAENIQFLHRLPGFELKREMPAQMHALLDRLHEVESSRQGPRQR